MSFDHDFGYFKSLAFLLDLCDYVALDVVFQRIVAEKNIHIFITIYNILKGCSMFINVYCRLRFGW